LKRLGRYEILGELGRGAMGAVYRARDPKIDRIVAIKTILSRPDDPAEEEQYRKRFFREAQAAGKLSAAGIVNIYDIGEDDATKLPYIVMEFVAGKTLDQYVAESGGRLAVGRSLDLIQQIATALDAAHAQGILHRDIKPANIMVTEDGQTKIADFGIAKLRHNDFTMTGQILGTPAYMSPEQLNGDKALDGRSDLFSLGVIAYWLLTGQKPFAADNPTSLAFQIVYKEPPPPREVNSALAPEFDHLLRKMLAKEPAERYARCRDCAADIDDLRAGRPLRSLAAPVAVVEKTMATSASTVFEPHKTAAQAAAAGGTHSTLPLHSLAQEPTPPSVVFTPVESPTSTVAPPRQHGWFLLAVAVGVIALITAVVLIVGRFRTSPSTGTTAGTVVASTGNSGLELVGDHAFRSAQLSVWVDDNLVYQDQVHGTVHERSGVFNKTYWVSGHMDVPLKVPDGRHKVTVKIKALAENYLQAESVTGDFTAGRTRFLKVSFGSTGKDLVLDWE